MRAWLLGTGLAGAMALLTAPQAPRNTQVQATRHFLAAALRGEPRAARWLEPELRRTLGPAGVKGVLGQLAATGRRRGTAVELYKLGFRLEEDGTARPFVAYAWAADSGLARKREWIDVAFRDTAARQVLSFELRRTD